MLVFRFNYRIVRRERFFKGFICKRVAPIFFMVLKNFDRESQKDGKKKRKKNPKFYMKFISLSTKLVNFMLLFFNFISYRLETMRLCTVRFFCMLLQCDR